jgi:hypothetical protein
MTSTRSDTIGPASRPVSIPDDVLVPGRQVAQGRIELPVNIWWTGSQRTFDLDDPKDLRRVYVLVLSEGTEEDVSHFIDGEILLQIFDELRLPRHVEKRWREWFSERAIEV